MPEIKRARFQMVSRPNYVEMGQKTGAACAATEQVWPATSTRLAAERNGSTAVQVIIADHDNGAGAGHFVSQFTAKQIVGAINRDVCFGPALTRRSLA
jgi:hypothetical protein